MFDQFSSDTFIIVPKGQFSFTANPSIIVKIQRTMNKRNKYSHPHVYSLVYQPVSHTPTHTHTVLHYAS